MMMFEQIRTLLAAMEPEAKEAVNAAEGIFAQLNLTSQVSIAISLKRLADYFGNEGLFSRKEG